MATTYRAEHIGSLLRPQELLDARVSHNQGDTTSEQLKELEDKLILDALEMQRQVGISVYSDGEYRRAWFAGAFEESAEGILIDQDAPPDRRWQGDDHEHANATFDEWTGSDGIYSRRGSSITGALDCDGARWKSK